MILAQLDGDGKGGGGGRVCVKFLGRGVSGVRYVFDEPTIGLHQRDTHRLTGVLRRLRDLGNTVLVIEHDLEMIAAADSIVDFGSGAGRHGGRVVAARFRYRRLPGRLRRCAPSDRALILCGARQHNLKEVTPCGYP